MESRDFEKIEKELTEAVLLNDSILIFNLYTELKKFNEKDINIMPETTYARYLTCLDTAKDLLKL